MATTCQDEKEENWLKNKDFLKKIEEFRCTTEQKWPLKIPLRRNNTVPKTLSGPIGKHRSRAIRVAEWRLSSLPAPWNKGR
jgi:hypothetical protein